MQGLYATLADNWPREQSRPAFVGESQSLDYRELDAATARMAAALGAHRVRRGDRVVAATPKSIASVVLYLSCLRRGAVFVPVNSAATTAEIAERVHQVEPALVVAGADASAAISRAGIDSRPLEGSDESLVAFASNLAPEYDDDPIDADELAAILFTSGTTGQPKGVMLSHRNLVINAEALARLWRMSSDDVLVHALPVFHAHGLFVALHLPLLAGATIRFHARFDAEVVVDALAGSTVFMGVPTHYARMLACERLDASTCRDMRLFVSGSAPLRASTWTEFRDRTGHEVLERYGMTETGMLASNPYDGPRVPGTVGFALPGVRTRILDEHGVPVARGEIGDLEVRGDNVTTGYWRDPATTARELRDGWFHTGDLASIDDDGRITLAGRSKDLVISGGFNVYPAEVERALDSLPDIADSAVIGVEHADLGEAVTAVVVARPGRSPQVDQIVTELRQQLSAYKCPKVLHLVDVLPRNSMGKVDKVALRKRFGRASPASDDADR